MIERQKDLGFKIFTDGELRRGNFMSDFNDAVEGVENEATIARTWQGKSEGPPVTTPLGVVTGKVEGVRRMTAVPSPRMSIGWSPVIFSA